LAGFAVGVVEKSEIIDGSKVAAGDVLVGLASSGAHSNGYSLVRKVLERVHGPLGSDAARAALAEDFHGRPFADVLMAPTRIYVKPILGLLGQVPVKALAHITGGGLVENVPRVLTAALRAVIRADSRPLPHLFEWLRQHGQIADAEMHRVFNCGIGMVVVVAPAD